MTRAEIKSVAQTDVAGLFSICFDGESYTEFQKFIQNNKDAYSKDLGVILRVIGTMMEATGFLERYFRPEGKMRDRVCALPIASGQLRLYCLRLSDQILIVGNGGVKNVRTYEDSEELNGYVVTLQNLDKALKIAVKKGTVTIEERKIEGDDLKFDI